MSTLDLVGKGRFALLTGMYGHGWAWASQDVATELGIELAAHVIGPGRTYTDLYDDWALLREVAEDGCVMVRPDGYVGWRSMGPVDDLSAELRGVLRAILAVD